MRPSLRVLLIGGWASVLGGCIPSNVVATEDRLVAQPVASLTFAPAPGLKLDGLYSSVEITGDAAITLRRVFYVFRADGTYTAAALAEAGERAEFQTLSGTWSSDPRGLSLDGAEPALLEQAEGHLRITAPNGAVVLRREEAP